MKKSIFILAALFVDTFANAQITLLHTFDDGGGFVTANINFGNTYAPDYGYIEAPYFYSFPKRMENEARTIDLYNKADFSLSKTIIIPEGCQGGRVSLLSQNILTTDNKICFCVSDYNGPSYIVNEDSQLIATLEGDNPKLVMVDGRYLLITSFDYGKGKYIYSVPGNGETQAVNTPYSPKRSARKVARDGQVIVQTDDNTYTLTGAEVK